MRKFNRLIILALLIGALGLSASCSQKHQVRYQLGTAMDSPDGMTVVDINGQTIIWLASDKLFTVNTTEFTPNGYSVLEDVAGTLKDYPNSNIHISGNADPLRGHARAPCEDISTKQAAKVAAVLMSMGIDKGSRILTYTGDKDKYPIATNKKLTGMTTNRRIEIIVYDKNDSYSITGDPEKHFPDEDFIF